MDSYDFQTTVHAKCILTGEHAVLRGTPALVFPVSAKYFRLSYQKTDDQKLHADHGSSYGENTMLLFWPVLEKALNMLGHSMSDITGKFVLENTIPIAAGLGFSATICVAVSRWLVWMGYLEETKVFSFARSLEDLFHGKSSGIDVIGVMKDEPTHYRIGDEPELVEVNWQPQLYLSYCNSSSITVKGVTNTEKLWKSNPDLAQRLHDLMSESVHLAQSSLSKLAHDGYNLMKKAITIAHDCFRDWGLIEGELDEHIAQLKKCGAVAAKPTGSGGGGGYVLSLWQGSPPDDLPFELTPLLKHEEKNT
ncbi:MAG: mevalonate kinase [Coxiellaceae bacterium]|nr:mevalonate kinase [Coxiellaceae bacterium]